MDKTSRWQITGMVCLHYFEWHCTEIWDETPDFYHFSVMFFYADPHHQALYRNYSDFLAVLNNDTYNNQSAGQYDTITLGSFQEPEPNKCSSVITHLRECNTSGSIYVSDFFTAGYPLDLKKSHYLRGKSWNFVLLKQNPWKMVRNLGKRAILKLSASCLQQFNTLQIAWKSLENLVSLGGIVEKINFVQMKGCDETSWLLISWGS